MGRVGRFHLKGTIAWLAWLFVHILFLIGFRNRLLVVLEWAWAYATWGRGARLIVDTAEQWQLVAHDVRTSSGQHVPTQPPMAPAALPPPDSVTRH